MENWEKVFDFSEKVFDFSDICILIGKDEFYILLRECSKLAVNVLTSTPKILDLTKNNFSWLRWPQNDEKIG